MGMYDTIEGVSSLYDNQVKLWDCEMQTYGVGDLVPSVDGAETYSVRLQGGTATPRYVLVVDGMIVDVMAEAPREGSPVFSKWGGSQDEENPLAVAVRGLKQELDKKDP